MIVPSLDWMAHIGWKELFSGVAGSIIGGGFSLMGARQGAERQARLQSATAQAQEAALVRGLLGALAAELEVLRDRYLAEIGKVLRAHPDGVPFEAEWIADQEYFAIYTGNCGLFGRIPDPDLRYDIVKTYTVAKGLLDRIKFNGKLLRERAILQGMIANRRRDQLDDLHRQMVAYAAALKETDAVVTAAMSDLIPRLKAAAAG